MITLDFEINRLDSNRVESIPLQEVLCIGFAGRNKEKALEHVRELAEMGVPAPESIPSVYPVSGQLATTAGKIQVVGQETSGEVEFCLLWHQGQLYIGLGSDHTDRDLEKASIPKAKQVCPKPVAPQMWPYEEVKDHWDQLELRSWVVVDGEQQPYQEGTVANILPVERLQEEVTGRYGQSDLEGRLIYSGTVPTLEGLKYGEHFAMEIYDPVLKRRIAHQYQIGVLVPAE